MSVQALDFVDFVICFSFCDFVFVVAMFYFHPKKCDSGVVWSIQGAFSKVTYSHCTLKVQGMERRMTDALWE